MAETRRITSDSIVDLIFHLTWKSAVAVHTESYRAGRVNTWRDFLPQALFDTLMGREAGERFDISLTHEDIGGAFTDRKVFDIENRQFDRQFKQGVVIEPRLGRFYPRGMLKGITGIFKVNTQAFRCVGLNNGRMTVDLNHPLAGKDLRLSVVVEKIDPKHSERGGTSVAWLETLASGPGMQAPWKDQRTDYFSNDTFKRDDEASDASFYQKPRYVHHMDKTAREMVSNTYGCFLTDGMHVLDLMSSWRSHIPANLHLNRLVGLGLNEDELAENPQLSDRLVHDLNADTRLPFDSDTFDAVINTVSVEYLTDPLAVFKEVHRILRPDGYFMVTFSNRWFPTKAIRIWPELHEFERMGLVLEYFMRTEGFKDLQTYSIRGLPRPHDDKYASSLAFSDPIFAVWGKKCQT